MPQIDTPLLLDILLGLVMLLFIPFGIRRGVAKEAMVSAGILLGATLATRFASSWGQELSARFGLEPGAAAFAVSALLLLSGTFLLGYGAGAALGVLRPGTASRLTGGLLAAFNAALLLSYLLAWIEEYLQQGSSLDDGIISRALLWETDLLLLAGAGILLFVTMLGWIVNATRSRRQPREIDMLTGATAPARQRPVRVASSADAGKYEPGAEPAMRSGRFGPGLDATTPLPMPAPPGARSAWSDEDRPRHDANGHGSGYAADGAMRSDSDTSTPGGDQTVWSEWNAAAEENTAPRPGVASQWPVAPSVGVTDDDRCAVCHGRVGPRDVFCPECGATL